VYQRGDGKAPSKLSDEEVAKASRVGYNPAVVAKGFTKEMADRVRSKNSRSEWALQDVEQKVEARF